MKFRVCEVLLRWLMAILMFAVPMSALPNSTAEVRDVFLPLLPQDVLLRGGFLGSRIDANATRRMRNVDEDDLLDAFERRDVAHQDWQGEHVGKYLHAAALTWNYTRDADLRAKIDRVVTRLLKTQLPDGYLGTYPEDKRWTSWDVWTHKYDLIGLLTYYEFTKRANHGQATPLGERSLDACRKIGDLLVASFGTGPGQRDLNKAGEHVGMAADSVLEPVVMLFRATSDRRYLDFAHYIVENYDGPGGPAILASLERTGSVRKVANAKAYEMMSNFNGLLELYRVTGEKRLLRLMKAAWNDIVANRLYLTGSASSFEVFQDEFHLPNEMSANIGETCVTVTWEQMNLQLLRLTGDARYADQLEKTVYNHLLAAQQPGGDDWAYYTPLEGRKPYDSVTTCCHSSGPRGLALVSGMAAMASADGGLVINFYNSGVIRTRLPGGAVTATMATDYPRTGEVALTVSPVRAGQRFPLRLRIPPSAASFRVTVNGRAVVVPRAGYALVDRAWKKGDVVKIQMRLADRLIIGDHGNAGKAAVMHGPLVLALDREKNRGVAALNRIGLGAGRTSIDLRLGKGLEFRVSGYVRGKGKVDLTLVPFADAGSDGKSLFKVWIPMNVPENVTESLLSGLPWTASRKGNVGGDITDDDFSTFAVTFDERSAAEDTYAVQWRKPRRISRVVFGHGHTFHDGGWFDTAGGAKRPRVEVQTEKGGAWRLVATLAEYPATTATDSRGLKDGQKFEARFAPMAVVGVRVTGVPARGDNPAQSFSSCAELQAFLDRR